MSRHHRARPVQSLFPSEDYTILDDLEPVSDDSWKDITTRLPLMEDSPSPWFQTTRTVRRYAPTRTGWGARPAHPLPALLGSPGDVPTPIALAVSSDLELDLTPREFPFVWAGGATC